MDFTRPPLCCCCCGGPHLSGNCETGTYCDLCGKDLVYCSCEPEWVQIPTSYPWMAQPEILEEPEEINQSYPWLPVEQSQHQSIQPQLEYSKLEDALTQFMQMAKTTFLSQDQAMKNMERNHEASIKHLESLIGQLSKQLAELSSSGFSANTTDNPKHETAEAISLRSGRELKTPEVDCEKRVLVENEKNELSKKMKMKKMEKLKMS